MSSSHVISQTDSLLRFGRISQSKMDKIFIHMENGERKLKWSDMLVGIWIWVTDDLEAPVWTEDLYL